MYGDFKGKFEKRQFSSKNCCDYFLANFWKHLDYFLLQLLVTFFQWQKNSFIAPIPWACSFSWQRTPHFLFCTKSQRIEKIIFEATNRLIRESAPPARIISVRLILFLQKSHPIFDFQDSNVDRKSESIGFSDPRSNFPTLGIDVINLLLIKNKKYFWPCSMFQLKYNHFGQDKPS